MSRTPAERDWRLGAASPEMVELYDARVDEITALQGQLAQRDRELVETIKERNILENNYKDQARSINGLTKELAEEKAEVERLTKVRQDWMDIYYELEEDSSKLKAALEVADEYIKVSRNDTPSSDPTIRSKLLIKYREARK